jgi:hypothetical protein
MPWAGLGRRKTDDGKNPNRLAADRADPWCGAVLMSPPRAATVSVVVSRCGLPCVLQGSAAHMADLAPLASPWCGAFSAIKQPTARLGVGVVGLLCSGGIGKPVMASIMTYPPSPAPLVAGLFVCAARRNADTETNAPARRLRGGLAGLARRRLATTTSTFSGVPDRQAYHPPPWDAPRPRFAVGATLRGWPSAAATSREGHRPPTSGRASQHLR